MVEEELEELDCVLGGADTISPEPEGEAEETGWDGVFLEDKGGDDEFIYEANVDSDNSM